MHEVKSRRATTFEFLHLYRKYEAFMMIYTRSPFQNASLFFYTRRYFMLPKVIGIQDSVINTLCLPCIFLYDMLWGRLINWNKHITVDKWNKNHESFFAIYKMLLFAYKR